MPPKEVPVYEKQAGVITYHERSYKRKTIKLIIDLCPSHLLGNLLQLTYSLVDTRLVGSFLGEDALAAVGATGTLSNLIVGF